MRTFGSEKKYTNHRITLSTMYRYPISSVQRYRFLLRYACREEPGQLFVRLIGDKRSWKIIMSERLMSSKPEKVDIAIITIREDEFEAVLQRFKPAAYREPRGRSYGICHIQTKMGHKYTIAIARCSWRRSCRAMANRSWRGCGLLPLNPGRARDPLLVAAALRAARACAPFRLTGRTVVDVCSHASHRDAATEETIDYEHEEQHIYAS